MSTAAAVRPSTDLFISVDEVVSTLSISKSKAYKIIKQLNDELEKKGIMVISGRVNRRYFNSRFGISDEPAVKQDKRR